MAHEGVSKPSLWRQREALFHLAELAAGKLKGEIEVDEACCSGWRKGCRGRDAAGKSVVYELLERDGPVDPKGVAHLSAEELMRPIRAPIRKGLVYNTNTFCG